jgi:hypothetical protein
VGDLGIGEEVITPSAFRYVVLEVAMWAAYEDRDRRLARARLEKEQVTTKSHRYPMPSTMHHQQIVEGRQGCPLDKVELEPLIWISDFAKPSSTTIIL